MTTTISSLQALNLVYAIAEADVPPGHADYMSKKEMAAAARRAYAVLEPIVTKVRDAENEGKGDHDDHCLPTQEAETRNPPGP
jgi:hypothetical protein